MKVVPPNFSYVEDGIFRCGLPSPRHYGFLSSLQLRTCVLLTDTADPIFYRWLLENNICVLCPLMSSGGTISSGPLAGTSSANTPSLSYRGHPGMPSPFSFLHSTTLSHYLPTTDVLSGSAPLVTTGGFVGAGYPLASGSFPMPIRSSSPSTAAAPSSAVDSAAGGVGASTSSTVGTVSTGNEQEEVCSNVEPASSSVTLPPTSPPISASGVVPPPHPPTQRSMDAPASHTSYTNSSGEGGAVSGVTASLSLDNGVVNGASGALPSASSSVPSISPSTGEGSSSGLVPPANTSRTLLLEANVVGSAAASAQNIHKGTTAMQTSGSSTSTIDRSGTSNMSLSNTASRGNPALSLPIAPPLPYSHPPLSPSFFPPQPLHFPPPHSHSYVHYPGVEVYFGDPRSSWMERREGMGEVASERGGMFPATEEGTDTMKTLTGLMSLSESVVVRILEVLLDRNHYPLLITCSKGRYRTGIVCACLRKMQRWNLVSILEEYRRFAGDKSRVENEEFIELFDTDLVSLVTRSGLKPSILY